MTSAHMLEKRGWICILFPSKLDAWSEAGMVLKRKEKKSQLSFREVEKRDRCEVGGGAIRDLSHLVN